MDYGYQVVAPPAAPGSGAAVTLWDSSIDYGRTATANTVKNVAARYKRALVTIYSSHISGTGGLVLAWNDAALGSSTWRTINGAGSGETVAATTITHRDFDIIGPNMRIVYTNSANVLTTWQVTIMLDPFERAAGV